MNDGQDIDGLDGIFFPVLHDGSPAHSPDPSDEEDEDEAEHQPNAFAGAVERSPPIIIPQHDADAGDDEDDDDDVPPLIVGRPPPAHNGPIYENGSKFPSSLSARSVVRRRGSSWLITSLLANTIGS